MKVIMCYGDSNTWGYNPATGERFPEDERWTGVLKRELGDGYKIIEAGLNGRTTVWDDPIEGDKNGKEQLIPFLETNKPLDLVIIMLGTNDLKMRFSVPASDIADGAGVLVGMVQKSETGVNGSPKVLLIAPPPVSKLTNFAEMFQGAEAKSKKFSQHYRRVAEERGCDFLDTANVIVSSDLDGIHLEKDEHQKLGKAVAHAVRDILEPI